MSAPSSSSPDPEGARLEAELSQAFPNIEDLDCRGRRVFLRADPLVLIQGGATGSSLSELLEREARVVVGTHISAEALEAGADSVEAIGAALSERLGVEVFMPDECGGDAVVRVLHQLRPGQICVLPDLGVQPGETSNDERFARSLAANADAYVGDAFAQSHLAHASLVRLPRLLPRRALGLQARRELLGFRRLLGAPARAVGLCLGGRRFSEKVPLLEAWLPRLGTLCVGGQVAATLLAAAGRAPAELGAEPERLAQARSLLARVRDLELELHLPIDLRVRLPDERHTRVVSPRAVPPDAQVLDIGPESWELFSRALRARPQLLWWGPLGDVESPQGAEASGLLAELCARPEPRSVVLGGSTRQFVRGLPAPVQAGIDLVSTGQTAARALLTGSRLPGIEALRLRH